MATAGGSGRGGSSRGGGGGAGRGGQAVAKPKPQALAFTPSSYDYMQVTTGQTASKTFTLANTGKRASGTLRLRLRRHRRVLHHRQHLQPQGSAAGQILHGEGTVRAHQLWDGDRDLDRGRKEARSYRHRGAHRHGGLPGSGPRPPVLGQLR